MKFELHPANERGKADYGWLNTNYYFSFSRYYNPDRMGFGKLRVINDDTVAPGKGFDTHPHDNMEIITIPLFGDLAHKDSMGNSSVIKEGEIQVMSAGKGILHSEYNANNDKEVKLFQIWVIPNVRNVEPRYQQIPIKDLEKDNEFFQILSPNPNDEGVWIHQDAWFHLGNFSKGKKAKYTTKLNSNIVYLIVVEGSIEIIGTKLATRDAIGLKECNEFELTATDDSKILIMEIPDN